jgi:hypothetical protein
MALKHIYKAALDRLGISGNAVDPASYVELVTNMQANLTAPDGERVFSAMAAIRQAITQNAQAGEMVAAIAQDDLEIAVAWSVNNARQHLISPSYRKDFEESGQTFNDYFNAKSWRGSCGYASSLAMYPINDLGLEDKLPNVGDFERSKGTRHAFAVVTAPVQNANGEIGEKSYLVDATYKQFCVPYNDKKPLNEYVDLEGYKLASTERGKALLQEILENGYFELTDETAKLYIDSFNDNKAVFDDPSAYITQMRNYHYDDYTREEFEGWGINVSLPDAAPKAVPPV